MKKLNDEIAYDNHYQYIASTKYRKNVFSNDDMRIRLKAIIEETLSNMPNTECIESTVAFNHIHVLLKSDLEPSKIGQKLYGVSSRQMRKEFPVLKELNANGLWGGRSYKPIKDENHLRNCISYIKRHRPDNTKVEI